MSNCIKDDYDLVKKCSKCGIISLKSNFHRDIKTNDELTPHCNNCRKLCRKKYYNEHYDLEINRRKKYRFENRDKIKKYRCGNREKTKECVKNKKIGFKPQISLYVTIKNIISIQISET